jgi:prolyl-tRNA synthetase
MPVIAGKKTEREKFAGALHTYCIEALMQDGKALQSGTSHHLGQNFAKAFDVKFQDMDKELKYVYASSWGVSTRLIGAMVMAHSDDDGLVIPPRLAPLPVVFVPIWRTPEERDLVLKRAGELTEGWDPLSYKIDDREQFKPGFKFNHWEVRGVPLRIEIGPRDCETRQVVLVRRDTGEKAAVPTDDLRGRVDALLGEIQDNLLNTAKRRMDDNTRSCDDYEDYKAAIEKGGFFKIHWCGNGACEMKLQEDTRSTIRCIPFDAPEEAGPCLICGEHSDRRVLTAQAY